jgi:acyl carrier protein
MTTPTAQALKVVLAKVKSDPLLFTRFPDSAHLVDEIGLDSIEMLQLMLEIESSLAIRIDFDRLEFDCLRSIHTLAAFLETMPPAGASTGAK